MKRLALILFLAAQASLAAGDITCKVVGISDGDTLTCLAAEHQQLKVRLAEIDTPEKAQPYGQKSRQALADLAFKKLVTLQVQGRDRHGRTRARVSVAGQDVNREMVRRGAAWVYRQYNRDKLLLQVEAEAIAAGRGLWSLPTEEITPPWEWRKVGSK